MNSLWWLTSCPLPVPISSEFLLAPLWLVSAILQPWVIASRQRSVLSFYITRTLKNMIVWTLKKWKELLCVCVYRGRRKKKWRWEWIQEQENDELGTCFCYGYGKLMLLVQLCVFFATGFCSMGVAAIHRIKTICYCWDPRKTHKVTNCSESWKVPCSETKCCAFYFWKYTAVIGESNWTFCYFDYPVGTLVILKTLIEVEHINN